MVIAWLFFATTGILTARYYKYLLPNVKLFKLDFWFNIHRPFMLFVPVLSIISLLIILSQLNWKWVEIESKAGFAHSIFGIAAIGFSFIQPFIAVLRCDKDHQFRWIFNYVHRTIGIAALLFSSNLSF